jgi:hypothetical protein
MVLKVIKDSGNITFCAECIALKTGNDLIKLLCCKLQMMGVPLEGPVNVLVDNDSIVKNSTIPASTHQKNIILFVITWFARQLLQSVFE